MGASVAIGGILIVFLIAFFDIFDMETENIIVPSIGVCILYFLYITSRRFFKINKKIIFDIKGVHTVDALTRQTDLINPYYKTTCFDDSIYEFLVTITNRVETSKRKEDPNQESKIPEELRDHRVLTIYNYEAKQVPNQNSIPFFPVIMIIYNSASNGSNKIESLLDFINTHHSNWIQ